MAHIEFNRRVAEDLERITEHLERYETADILSRIDSIIQAISVLELNPHIGRPAGNDRRELVIGKGSQGHVARYCYLDALDIILILGIRAQREAGFKD